jgi:hypothetical protein
MWFRRSFCCAGLVAAILSATSVTVTIAGLNSDTTNTLT